MVIGIAFFMLLIPIVAIIYTVVDGRHIDKAWHEM